MRSIGILALRALSAVVGCIFCDLFLAAASVAQSLPRIIVSTDIGGDDPDDFQSMVHLFTYADRFQIEGLISSPPGGGRVRHILETIDAYEADYAKLSAHAAFPSPDYLRSISKQGQLSAKKSKKISFAPSEGSAWIVERALSSSTSPLYILAWGSLTDVAAALASAPQIASRIRLLSIGGWNTKQDPTSRNYIFKNFPKLWWIETNTAYKGIYLPPKKGPQELSNRKFVEIYVAPFGVLGAFYYSKKKLLKMGDTPTVLFLLNNNNFNPARRSWGGQYQRISPSRPKYWTDSQDKKLLLDNKPGAISLTRERTEFLMDWATRMQWLAE